jgi:Protein of unknown function (DUF3306)
VSDDFGAKLSRWSQRKAAARRGAPAEEAVPEPQPEKQAAEPPVDEAKPAEDTPALPPVEELTAESDYTVFLGEKVPEALKRAALRKLWGSDPVLANLDGLNDYDEDYNLANSLVGVVRTAYQVGKGYVDEAAEKLPPPEAGEAAEPAEEKVVVAANENKIIPPVDDADSAAQDVGEGEDCGPADGPAQDKAV